MTDDITVIASVYCYVLIAISMNCNNYNNYLYCNDCNY